MEESAGNGFSSDYHMNCAERKDLKNVKNSTRGRLPIVPEQITEHGSTKIPSLSPSCNEPQSKQQQQTQLQSPFDETETQTSRLSESINRLVQQRAKARWNGDYVQADLIRQQIKTLAPQVILTDIPRKQGGGSTWTTASYNHQLSTSNSLSSNYRPSGMTVLQLAHASLGLAVTSSQTGIHGYGDQLTVNADIEQQQQQQQHLLQQALSRWKKYPSNTILELQGRKAADAAFWFVLSGVYNTELLNSLANIAAMELERFGTRNSCRAKHVQQILDRFSAAGIVQHTPLQKAATKALQSKPLQNYNLQNNTHVAQTDTLVKLDFFSDKCLLMLWRFSTRQRKQRLFLQQASNHWLQQQSTLVNTNNTPTTAAATTSSLRRHHDDSSITRVLDWNRIYNDPTKPLILDIGCGMGVSLLGLTQQTSNQQTQSSPTTNQYSSSQPLSRDDGILEWSDCNFCGVDLSGLAIQYAQTLTKIWNLDGTIYFFRENAETLLRQIQDSYPGPVLLCLIQFPTPFRLLPPTPNNDCTTHTSDTDEDDESALRTKKHKAGNAQLPSSATDGFMVSEHLLHLIHETLDSTSGKLLVQSNCEDVALWIRNTATTLCNFECMDVASVNHELHPFLTTITTASTPPPPPTISTPTKRTLDWIAMGGQRAVGHGWATSPLLPRLGRTETEVACILNGTPIHRCVLHPPKLS